MLLLRQKFEFQNIRLAAFKIWIATCEIRIAVYHIRLAACYSNCYNEIFFKIIIWPQNFIKLYYDPKRYESFQICPISKFLHNALSIPKLSKLMISPKLCEIIKWPKIFKYFQIGPNLKFWNNIKGFKIFSF